MTVHIFQKSASRTTVAPSSKRAYVSALRKSVEVVWLDVYNLDDLSQVINVNIQP
ncbi:predicted protein [Sclerotinia sclerotiorum 1980 UF-70]|uniref:Uncharacterized protein n=1 Tax=Sclerotinia sclerotiorum (strain ATCC 18683 / 1980 / Ss-1) TaxID=665079 RepID=A7E4S2_SCLS1|nr:predicted protein [Sclerotinia sclerotiorum 1980 UF-70]EDN90894.1 predicted protein [Sclerotinia sclerotiorum 1980 UF-70]